MTRLRAPFFALAAASLLTAACGFQHSSGPLAPTATSTTTTTTPAAGTNPAGTPSLVGLWTSNTLPVLPSPTTCGNFQYQITSQTAASIAGTFSGLCGGGLAISGNASGQLNGTSVPTTVTGTAALPGIPSCAFSLNAVGSLDDNGNTLRLPYSGTTCLGPISGTEVLRRPTPAAPVPTPTPTPTPAPMPTPAPAPTSNDAIDLHQVTVTGPRIDIASWPATAMLTTLDFGGDGVRVEFTKKDGPGRWPDVVPPGWSGALQYTLWMVVNINGQWYTSGGVEFWYGLGRSGGPPSQYAMNWYYSPDVWGPLSSHQPAVGEQVGFFVTAGDTRAKEVTLVRERSNVVVVPFPSDAGAVFSF
jgi:hypothetical protein